MNHPAGRGWIVWSIWSFRNVSSVRTVESVEKNQIKQNPLTEFGSGLNKGRPYGRLFLSVHIGTGVSMPLPDPHFIQYHQVFTKHQGDQVFGLYPGDLIDIFQIPVLFFADGQSDLFDFIAPRFFGEASLFPFMTEFLIFRPYDTVR